MDASIFIVSNIGNNIVRAYELIDKNFNLISETLKTEYLKSNGCIINYNNNPKLSNIITKINENSSLISDFYDVKNGVQAYTVGEGTPKLTKEMKDEWVYHSNEKKTNKIEPFKDNVMNIKDLFDNIKMEIKKLI